MRLLVTGGAGFIGSNFIRYTMDTYPSYKIINLDALTYAGHLENLESVAALANYRFVHGSIEDTEIVDRIVAEGIDAIVHFAAESHVDRSIVEPNKFLKTNVLGTQVLLDVALKHEVGRFLHISTDEVYGALGDTGLFTEQSPLMPNSPYSASKASSDFIVRAYHETYGLPAIITRCSNNYGAYQYPEKLIPLTIMRALNDQPIPVYGTGLNVRDWLHVMDHCRALDLVLHKGVPGKVYNIGGNNERTNLSLIQSILAIMDKPNSLMQFIEDRLGHDWRYAIDSSYIRTELGWEPVIAFGQGLQETVAWYIDNQQWCQQVMKKRV